MFSMEQEFQEIDSKNSWNSVYQKIRHKSNNYDYTCKDARRMDNKSLNRYRDVNPYDHSRVILKRGDKDYINASLVKVKAANRTYILTQGPLPTTTSHFWLMVWEQQTKAILMLNRIIEKNTVKCHQYWPMSQDEELVLTGVGLKVAFLGEKPATNYTVRELMLTDLESGQKRVVLHLHYTTWPDFGVPESPAAFLAFLQAVRESGALDVDVGPPVVHCSAGIGRSGTFCLVDSCLVLIEANGGRLDRVDVQEVLLEMRKYRMGLIQTPDQLRFSYLAILEGARALSCCQQKDAHPTADERVLSRSPERNGITEESSESEATDSSDDEDDGDDEDTMGGGKDASENGEGSSRLPMGAGDSPPPLPPRLKRSSEENSNSSSEAKDLMAGEPGAKETSPRKSTGEEAELRRRQRRERVERTSQMLQRMRQKQRSSEAWGQRRRLLKRVSLGLVLLLGTGVLVYKYYDSGK
ncbi:tyrosine-protein phosphatase non-receptor type 2-like isoform X1 [Dermacentor andersoni]|uniref:tyrosine-protein phosphatase non-receptor type 2-like isoform X1 n=1 Tax=Dermacentor andersoni TaxID=34620 RepID=UPI002155AF0E|nr:tyrosine-protein phosphatase non-receptor type 2-like isoform X1 [Dermacentor andersoni]